MWPTTSQPLSSIRCKTHQLVKYSPLETCPLSFSQLRSTVYKTTPVHQTCDPPYSLPLSFDRSITNPVQCSQLLCSKRHVIQPSYSQPFFFVRAITNHMQCGQLLCSIRHATHLIVNLFPSSELWGFRHSVIEWLTGDWMVEGPSLDGVTALCL